MAVTPPKSTATAEAAISRRVNESATSRLHDLGGGGTIFCASGCDDHSSLVCVFTQEYDSFVMCVTFDMCCCSSVLFRTSGLSEV